MARKRHTIERGSLAGTGASITEAKADLNSQIDAALTGSYDPRIVSYRGLSAIVWRDLGGWVYKIQWPEDHADGVRTTSCCSSPFPTADQACQNAAHHIISQVFQPDEFYADEDIPASLTCARSRDSLISTFRFYRAHRWASANGITGDLHRWACDHCRDPQFVNRPVPAGWDSVETSVPADVAISLETLLSAIGP